MNTTNKRIGAAKGAFTVPDDIDADNSTVFNLIEEVNTPTFHPVHERGEDAWFPGNESSSLLIAIQHVWEDIERLNNLRKQASDSYDKKLLLKYIVIEVRSLTDLMNRLQTKVMSAETYEPSQKPLYRGISSEELSLARNYWNVYSIAKKAVDDDITRIRNKIAAHRDIDNWNGFIKLWDMLDTKLIADLLNAIPNAFNHAKELNIYEWNRVPEPGSIEIIGAPVRTWLFENS